jgi:hypothetical protein
MSNEPADEVKLVLPARVSLEYLKRLAKERLAELRRSNPHAKLAAAQLAVARDYGHASWRSLKMEVERRRVPELALFFAACQTGDLEVLRRLLELQPGLIRERSAHGSTGLHLAARHAGALRLLLQH